MTARIQIDQPEQKERIDAQFHEWVVVGHTTEPKEGEAPQVAMLTGCGPLELAVYTAVLIVQIERLGLAHAVDHACKLFRANGSTLLKSTTKGDIDYEEFMRQARAVWAPEDRE